MAAPSRFRSALIAPKVGMTHLAVTIRWQNQVHDYLELSPGEGFHDQWSRVSLADKPVIGWCRTTQRWYVDYLSSFTESLLTERGQNSHGKCPVSSVFEVPELKMTIDGVQFFFVVSNPSMSPLIDRKNVSWRINA